MATNKKPLIIYIDDDMNSTRLMQKIVTHEGYQLICANTPEEGMIAVETEKPDLVLVDIEFKGYSTDGVDLIREIREAKINVPLLAITVYETGDVEEEVLAAGGTGVIEKPVMVAKIRDMLADNFK